jgi:tetratricopeptide (TPR) repeat protein
MNRLVQILLLADDGGLDARQLRRVVSLLLAALLAFTGIIAVQGRLEAIRRDADLTDDELLASAPPGMVFVVMALGGFRGLIADALYLRAQRKQEQERYFEMVQLSQWAVDLQPRFTDATAYLAWNMAYNISVTFSDPRDRWRWVQRGIELYRDKALVYSPRDPKLYQQLGWIYQHKIGQILDDAHYYYKSQLAMQMMEVLGDMEAFDWERFAAVPYTESELSAMLADASDVRATFAEPPDEATRGPFAARLEQAPVLPGSVTVTARGRSTVTHTVTADRRGIFGGDSINGTIDYQTGVIKGLRFEQEIEAGSTLVVTYRSVDPETARVSRFWDVLAAADLTVPQLEETFRAKGTLPEALAEALAKIEIGARAPAAAVAADGAELAELFLRNRWLRDRQRLDPERIHQIVQKHGPLDFRIAESHAIYWASIGLSHAKGEAHVDCDRMISQSMQNSFKQGRIVYLPRWEFKETVPDSAFEAVVQQVPLFEHNLDIVDQARQAYISAMEKNPGNRSFKSGYENFLIDAIVTLFAAGREKKAAEVLGHARELRKGQERFETDTRSFVLKELAKDIAGMGLKQASMIVGDMMGRIMTSMAYGELLEAYNYDQMARYIHRKYNSEQDDARDKMRRSLPPYQEMLAILMTRFRMTQAPPVVARFEYEWFQATGQRLPPLGEMPPGLASPNLLQSLKPGDLPLQRN